MDTKVKFLNLGCGPRYVTDDTWTNVDSRPFPNVVQHNLLKPLPFQDNEFDAVYHSDVLEHLPKRYAPIFMRECYRVLKTGGIIRVAVPDLESVVWEYIHCLDHVSESEDKYDWIVTELIDQMTRRRTGGEMLNFWRKKPMPVEWYVLKRVGSEPLGTMQSNVPPIPDEGLPLLEESDVEDLGCFMLSGEVHQWMYDRFSLGRLLRKAGFKKAGVATANFSMIPMFLQYYLDVETDGSVRKPDSLFMEAVK